MEPWMLHSCLYMVKSGHGTRTRAERGDPVARDKARNHESRLILPNSSEMRRDSVSTGPNRRISPALGARP